MTFRDCFLSIPYTMFVSVVSAPRQFAVSVGERGFSYELPGGSLATILYC
jgi:hypothetical protein